MVYEFLSIDDAVRASQLAQTLGPRGSNVVLENDHIYLPDNIAAAAFDSEFEFALRCEGIAAIKAAIVK